MTLAIYPGSFNPVTNGHLDISRRAARLFDTVIMAVFDRPNKSLIFSTAERLEMLRTAVRGLPNVRAESYTELTVAYARQRGATAIVRGLRTAADFEYEFQMSQINQTLAPEIDYVTLMSDHKYTFVSSSMVRELASYGADISWIVPPHVEAALRHVYKNKTV